MLLRCHVDLPPLSLLIYSLSAYTLSDIDAAAAGARHACCYDERECIAAAADMPLLLLAIDMLL